MMTSCCIAVVSTIATYSWFPAHDEREQPVARECRSTVVTHRHAHARPIDNLGGGPVVVRSRRRQRPAVDDSSDDFACEGASDAWGREFGNC